MLTWSRAVCAALTRFCFFFAGSEADPGHDGRGAPEERPEVSVDVCARRGLRAGRRWRVVPAERGTGTEPFFL